MKIGGTVRVWKTEIPGVFLCVTGDYAFYYLEDYETAEAYGHPKPEIGERVLMADWSPAMLSTIKNRIREVMK